MQPKECDRCHRTGEVAEARSNGYRGCGYVIRICPKCRGRGFVTEEGKQELPATGKKGEA